MVNLNMVGSIEKFTFEDFIEIIRILRSPQGCPWDREQTHESIRNDFIEETYEVADAIDNSDNDALCEELGDVLLQVALHSQIASDNGQFNISDVINSVAKKMIIRHPHVFSNVSVENSAEVLKNWDKIKMQEKSQSTVTDTLTSVPMAFPALMRAAKVQKRAAKVGFDWPDLNGPMDKLAEETAELKEALEINNEQQIFEEFGDLLFSVVNISRFIGVNAEQALNFATNKFISRFSVLEKIALERGVDIKNASLKQLDALWDEAKECIQTDGIR